jgi:hypothetical protein
LVQVLQRSRRPHCVRIINGERRLGFYNERAVAQLATALLDAITWVRPAGATQTASVRCEDLFIIMLALPMAPMAVILPVLVRIIVVIVTAIVATIILRMWLAVSRSH